MATAKKPAPKKPTVSRTPSKAIKKPLAKTTKVEGPSNYTKNSKVYQMPMTPAQEKAFNKLPKDTLFTLPKGATKLSAVEKKQMQARRIADRKRTLARGEAIIRRTVGKP